MNCIIEKSNVGNNILYYRQKKNLSQRELASMLYVSRTVVSRWESGSRLPDTNILPRLCNALEISLEQLLYEKSTQANVGEVNVRTIKKSDNVFYTYKNWPKVSVENLTEVINKILALYRFESNIFVAYYFFQEPTKNISAMFDISTDEVYSSISIVNKKIYDVLCETVSSNKDVFVSSEDFYEAISKISSDNFATVINKKIKLKQLRKNQKVYIPVIFLLLCVITAGTIGLMISKKEINANNNGNSKLTCKQEELPSELLSLEIIQNIQKAENCVCSTIVYYENTGIWSYVKILIENADNNEQKIVYIFNESTNSSINDVSNNSIDDNTPNDEGLYISRSLFREKGYIIYIENYYLI